MSQQRAIEYGISHQRAFAVQSVSVLGGNVSHPSCVAVNTIHRVLRKKQKKCKFWENYN